ncbi:molybdopterin-dependent oxidoreductase [Sphingosinicella sp. CPCC 101087]|uniref:molybdopterin-dependent oxidoreductase n=1 Tax=Sphingosinicella sp. CPCC 101087 TaxID=2497754 RepID=UPI00101C9123|nr:molybdopterin-dependent oxidoreductase [Sphingosinicella sp. CPCC 101087]
MITRRHLLVGAAGLLLPGCDRLNRSDTFRDGLRAFETLNLKAQRLITSRTALAREYSPEDISPYFRPNGNVTPGTDEYRLMAEGGFASWRLTVDGLVRRPLSLSVAELVDMPRRSQITRHDCVEGWSAIGKWTGVPLARLLDLAGLGERARYIVFHCMDRFGARPYYESIDLVDAYHPQTILAYGLNDRRLPIPNGAPLRLRVERQLGYKHAKYLARIEAVASLEGIYGGRGGYWEDSNDYEWYAGI